MEELLANIIKEADYSKLPALKVSAQDALGIIFFNNTMILIVFNLVDVSSFYFKIIPIPIRLYYNYDIFMKHTEYFLLLFLNNHQLIELIFLNFQHTGINFAKSENIPFRIFSLKTEVYS